MIPVEVYISVYNERNGRGHYNVKYKINTQYLPFSSWKEKDDNTFKVLFAKSLKINSALQYFPYKVNNISISSASHYMSAKYVCAIIQFIDVDNVLL